MVEITLRLPVEELGEALRALVGREQEGTPLPLRSGENPEFDQEEFRRMQAEESSGETAEPRRSGSGGESAASIRRARAEVGAHFSAPEPASYSVELPGAAAGARESGGLSRGEETGEKPEARRLERQWERDSRRYDGGFSLY